MVMRNNAGWSGGARKSAGTSRLRRRGISLIMLGAFALVVGGAAVQVARAALAAATLVLIGVVVCLTGWRTLVIARRREHSHPPRHPHHLPFERKNDVTASAKAPESSQNSR